MTSLDAGDRDPKYLVGAVLWGVVLWLLTGCAGHKVERETPASRSRLECIFSCKFEKNLYGPKLDACFKGCK